MKRLAGDVGGVGAQQEGNRGGDLLGQAEPPERDPLERPRCGGRVQRHFRARILPDEPGHHGVDRDPLARDLRRERLHQRLEAGLGGGRGGKHDAAQAELVGDERAHRHDSSAARARQQRQRVRGQPKERIPHHRGGVVELALLQLAEALGKSETGVVDEAVKPAEADCRLVDQGLRRCRLRQIAEREPHLGARGPHRIRHRIEACPIAPGVEYQRRIRPGEPPGERSAHPARRPGD